MLMALCEAASYKALRHDHKLLIEEGLRADKQARDEKWTQSIAVGSQDYVERIKKQLGSLASGRTPRQTAETTYNLQEPYISYNALLRGEKDDIGGENGYKWNIV